MRHASPRSFEFQRSAHPCHEQYYARKLLLVAYTRFQDAGQGQHEHERTTPRCREDGRKAVGTPTSLVAAAATAGGTGAKGGASAAVSLASPSRPPVTISATLGPATPSLPSLRRPSPRGPGPATAGAAGRALGPTTSPFQASAFRPPDGGPPTRKAHGSSTFASTLDSGTT